MRLFYRDVKITAFAKDANIYVIKTVHYDGCSKRLLNFHQMAPQFITVVSGSVCEHDFPDDLSDISSARCYAYLTFDNHLNRVLSHL